jgi:hypothetical protein
MTSWDYRGAYAENRRLLIEVLNTDLGLGFTFASLHDKESSAEVVSVVRRFKDRVEEGGVRQQIERRLSDLEKLISTL